MELKQKNFKESLAFGEEGEHEVAEYLIKKGVNVLPLYQFENSHAPYILSLTQKVVSPDLICFKNDSFMVEVKTKNQWVEFEGNRETGLNKTHFDYYKKIRELTGKQVFVIFNHKSKKPIGFYLVELMQYTRYWDGFHKGVKKYKEMVFYNYDILKPLNP